MEDFFTRYRNPMILGLALLLQVFGLAVQVKRPVDSKNPDSGSVRLVRLWAVDGISPVEKVFTGASHWIRESWHDYVNVSGLRHENLELREENERMHLEATRLSEDAAQARRLQVLLDFKEKFADKTVAAQVIGSSGAEQSRILYIDKGIKDGLRSGMAVITPDGVVGKVRDVFSSTAQVLMMNDLSSGVGALLEKSRLHGVVKGTASGEVVFDHIMSDEKVEPGERVITSGGDRIYPKGLPVGTVTQISPGSDLFLNIRIKPAADLSRLEEVLIVTQMQNLQMDMAETPMNATDILARRLPSVPPQIAQEVKQEKKPGAGAKLEPPAKADAKKPGVAKPNTVNPATKSPQRSKPIISTNNQLPALSPALKPAQSTMPKPAQIPEGTQPQ